MRRFSSIDQLLEHAALILVITRLFACWDWGFVSRRRNGCLSLVNVVCCHVEVSVCGADHSLRGVLPSVVCSECDSDASTVRRLWTTRAVEPWEGNGTPFSSAAWEAAINCSGGQEIYGFLSSPTDSLSYSQSFAYVLYHKSDESNPQFCTRFI
jgi:hypothetical protein